MFYRPSRTSPDEKKDILSRFWAQDPSLWSSDPAEQEGIRNRLGWISNMAAMRNALPEIEAFSREVVDSGFHRVILLGMGGSSLCPLILERTFPRKDAFPRLVVLDTTDPDQIEAVQKDVDLATTLFIFASKSGTTIEPNAQFHHFWSMIEGKVPQPGRNFIAITDPGTPLDTLAREKGFRNVFLNQPDIGGRYSALSFFGLVPAALLGIEPGRILDRAKDMQKRCSGDVTWERNPGCMLAEFLAENALQNRDKLSILADPALSSFGLWLEQLLAESSGKETRGIVPIVGETTGIPGFYGGERMFVYLKLKGTPEEDSLQGFVDELKKAEFPVYVIELEDLADLGGQFFLWEMATALACHFLAVNAFDEPDVRHAKEKTSQVLEQYASEGKMPVEFWVDPQSGINFRTSAMVASSMKSLSRSIRDVVHVLPSWGYFAFLPYLPEEPGVKEAIGEMRHLLRQERGCATTLGFGPRYLHSTGQLHKGGPLSSAFLIFTRKRSRDYPPIPGMGISFWHLQFAQAAGDFEALSQVQKRVIHVHFGEDYLLGLQSFAKVFARAIRS